MTLVFALAWFTYANHVSKTNWQLPGTKTTGSEASRDLRGLGETSRGGTSWGFRDRSLRDAAMQRSGFHIAVGFGTSQLTQLRWHN